jgi:hypothetical protein
MSDTKMDHTSNPPVYSTPPNPQAPMTYAPSTQADSVTMIPPAHSNANGSQSFIESVPPTQPMQKPQYHESIYTEAPKPTTVTPLQHLGEAPATVACPHCRYRVTTRVENEDTTMTTLVPLLLPLSSPSILPPLPQPPSHHPTNPIQGLRRSPLPILHLRDVPAVPAALVQRLPPFLHALRQEDRDEA